MRERGNVGYGGRDLVFKIGKHKDGSSVVRGKQESTPVLLLLLLLYPVAAMSL